MCSSEPLKVRVVFSVRLSVVGKPNSKEKGAADGIICAPVPIRVKKKAIYLVVPNCIGARLV